MCLSLSLSSTLGKTGIHSCVLEGWGKRCRTRALVVFFCCRTLVTGISPRREAALTVPDIQVCVLLSLSILTLAPRPSSSCCSFHSFLRCQSEYWVCVRIVLVDWHFSLRREAREGKMYLEKCVAQPNLNGISWDKEINGISWDKKTILWILKVCCKQFEFFRKKITRILIEGKC